MTSLSTCFFMWSSSCCFLSRHLRALFLFYNNLLSRLLRSGYWIFFSILKSWLLVEDSSPERSEKSNSSSECFISLILSLSDKEPVSSFLDAFLLVPTNLSFFFLDLRHHTYYQNEIFLLWLIFSLLGVCLVFVWHAVVFLCYLSRYVEIIVVNNKEMIRNL